MRTYDDDDDDMDCTRRDTELLLGEKAVVMATMANRIKRDRIISCTIGVSRASYGWN